MIFDKKTMFSDGQAVVADAASSEYVDAGPGIKNIGVGAEIFLHAQVVEDFNNLTSLKVKVQQDDNSSFNSPTDLVETGEVLAADLVAGYVFNIPVPQKITQRYLRLYYDTTGDAPTTGKITAGLVTDRDGGEHPDLTA